MSDSEDEPVQVPVRVAAIWDGEIHSGTTDDPFKWARDLAKAKGTELTYFEVIPSVLPDAAVWVDEEGVLRNLGICATVNRLLRPDDLPPGSPWYVLSGMALITGLADDYGNLTDLPEEVLAKLNAKLSALIAEYEAQ